MEERLDDIIERYFLNELTAAEQAEFERRSASDASFRQAVDLHRKALQAIRLQGKATVLGKLSERGRQLDAQKKAPNTRWWWLVGGAALVLALFCWLKWSVVATPETQVPPAALPQESTESVQPLDTAQVKPADLPPDQQPEKKRPIAAAQEKQERLFVQYFKPYRDETLEPSLRGNAELSASEKFQQLYWEGEYAEALAQFENLPPAAKNNDNWLFVRAECLLATGEQAAAAALFEKILANDRSRFMPAASWHLAWAYLKNGDLDKAKQQFGAVANETDSPWQKDAAAVLKALQ